MATFNINFGGPTTTISEVETTPLTQPLQEDDEANKIVDLVSEVIDGELDLGTTETVDIDNDGQPDYQYEYVYYYYDEDGVNGTVVDAQVAGSSVKVLGQNVTGVDIHTNTGNPPLTAS